MDDDLAAFLRELRSALDEHDNRIAALEGEPLLAFRMSEATEQRRRVVARMREAGLSSTRIAKATGAGRSTIMRDLAAVGVPTPDQVVGVNGRGWHRRNGSAGAAQ